MSRSAKDLAAEALELPLTARAELARQLLDSLDDLSEEENDLLWAEEAERRFAEYKAGAIEAIPADEVFARLRAARSDAVKIPLRASGI
jgi:putative addiction module component (TIGR02574 family)